MKLNTIIIYTKHLKHDITLLQETANTENVNVKYINDITELTSIVINMHDVLLFTDNKEGCQFALDNHIPYVGIMKELNASDIDDFSNAVCLTTDLCNISCSYALEQWCRAHTLPVTICKTKRFIIRELSVSDISDLYRIYQNPQITKCIPPLDNDISIEKEKQAAYIKYAYSFYGFGLWGVFLPDGTLIGRAGIEFTNFEGTDIFELSYLIDIPYQRKGYATECIEEIYKFATTQLEINSLSAFIATNNLASIKTAMKMGMKKTKECEYKGYSCYQFIIKDIDFFLSNYQKEKKRVQAAQSAYRYANKKLIQDVYKRVYKKNL